MKVAGSISRTLKAMGTYSIQNGNLNLKSYTSGVYYLYWHPDPDLKILIYFDGVMIYPQPSSLASVEDHGKYFTIIFRTVFPGNHTIRVKLTSLDDPSGEAEYKFEVKVRSTTRRADSRLDVSERYYFGGIFPEKVVLYGLYLLYHSSLSEIAVKYFGKRDYSYPDLASSEFPAELVKKEEKRARERISALSNYISREEYQLLKKHLDSSDIIDRFLVELLIYGLSRRFKL